MTKLASALPQGGNGLDTIAHKLVSKPHDKHVVIGVVDCSKVTTDHDNGSVEPTARMRRVELVHTDDINFAERLIRRGLDHRLGATVLPMAIEDDISEAFHNQIPASALPAEKNPDKDAKDQAITELHVELHAASEALKEAGRYKYGRARRVLSILADQVESGELPVAAPDLLPA